MLVDEFAQVSPVNLPAAPVRLLYPAPGSSNEVHGPRPGAGDRPHTSASVGTPHAQSLPTN